MSECCLSWRSSALQALPTPSISSEKSTPRLPLPAEEGSASSTLRWDGWTFSTRFPDDKFPSLGQINPGSGEEPGTHEYLSYKFWVRVIPDLAFPLRSTSKATTRFHEYEKVLIPESTHGYRYL